MSLPRNWTRRAAGLCGWALVIPCMALTCRAQAGLVAGGAGNTTAGEAAGQERWNVFYQATSVGQYHPPFRAPYSGAFSLRSHAERDVSLTTTLFLGLRLGKNTALYCDPEISGALGSARGEDDVGGHRPDAFGNGVACTV